MSLPHALILAAGASRRFGSPKAIAQFNGRTLLNTVVAHVSAVVGEDFSIVLGAHADLISSTASLPSEKITRHDSWTNGMSESLKHGIGIVPAAAPAALVVLVDQPLVSTGDLQRLIDAWRQAPSIPAVAEYSGDIGAPCILPRHFFEAVMQLTGDRGAKGLLNTLPRLTRVVIPNAALDIDTPEDLHRARSVSIDIAPKK